MSEPKLISPLLDNFVMGAPISDHHGVRCCPAMTKDADKRYIVKIISIPASQVQLDALLLAGAYSSRDSALSYFKELAEDVAEEVEILKKLSRFEGFVPYEDMQIAAMEGKVGYEVYLLSPYKRSLERHMRKKPMTHLNAVNLGLDLCASMVMCRRAGFLYTDLKPGNIFINEKNEYCIGDLGFIRLNSLKYASLPDKYRSAYTAPELADAMAYLNETIDTYAIGTILYQVYNDGKLPDFPEDGSAPAVPMYADYEMAEIIMKAISPDPADRWQDPMQMGQALVAYMQRNSVNDVPIVPLPETKAEAPAPAEPEPAAEETVSEQDAPAAETEAEPAAVPAPAEPEDIPEAEENTAVEEPAPEENEPQEAGTEDVSDLSFMDNMVSDDTAPDPESADDIAYEELSDETSDILAQADELLAMETPEPVVAPEPIDIPMPEPIVLNDPETAEPESVPEAAAPAQEDEQPSPEEPAAEAIAETDIADEVEPDYEDDDEEHDDEVVVAPRRRDIGCLIAAILAVLLLLGTLAGGYYYYNNYYLQNIEALEVLGQANDLTVLLTTDVDESLLTVICSDSYGNTRQAKVQNGKAVFEDLNPDTIYKISLNIEGFHQLTGDITDSYTTPAQTNIVQFEATAGSEDGSVILTFTVDGKDTNNWTITYTAEGENDQSVSFSGHIVTINGLVPSKKYTFRLSSSDELYIVGSDTVTYSAAALVYAENLTITECNSDGITAVWTVPEGATVEKWTVRCYSDGGYDQTMETAELTATFTGINPSEAFTIEVIADGMSIGTRTFISARSATITSTSADVSVPLQLTASWEITGTMPEDGWLVTYSLEGSDREETVRTTENSITVYPAMPDDVYTFTIQAADGTTVFENTFSYTAGPVQIFSGYGITADNLTFSMCRTPNKTNWSHSDLSGSAYTSTFSSGEKASFVVYVNKRYNTSDDVVEALFVIRDSSGEVVCTSSTSSSWTYMWSGNYCELDIPTMPTESGSYTINVYFNGMAAARDTFTIR